MKSISAFARAEDVGVIFDETFCLSATICCMIFIRSIIHMLNRIEFAQTSYKELLPFQRIERAMICFILAHSTLLCVVE